MISDLAIIAIGIIAGTACAMTACAVIEAMADAIDRLVERLSGHE